MSDYFELGYFSKTVGLKGHLILMTDADHPENFSDQTVLFTEENGSYVPLFTESLELTHRGSFKVKLEEVDTEEAACKWIGTSLFLPLSLLPKLEGNSFYYHEIIGFTAIDQASGEIGLIKNVLDRDPQPLYEIEKEGKLLYIPMVDAFLIKVDRESQSLHFNLPEGLLEVFD
jgi:16S rRNA processing protein RimM